MVPYWPTASRARAIQQPVWVEHMPDILAVLIIVFMSTRWPGLSKVMAVGWLACAGLLLALFRDQIVPAALRWWPLLLTPILAIVSFLWSDAPFQSARYGLQLLLTCFTGVFIAQVLSPMRFARAIFIGMLIFCILCIISGRQGPSFNHTVLIGLTGSKNSMGLMANMLLASSAAVIFLPGTSQVLRALGVVGVGIGAYLVMQAESTTAMLFAMGSAGLFVAMCLLQRTSPAMRLLFIFAAIICIAPVTLIWDDLNRMIADFMINTLHKDPTLTGRTPMWDRALQLIEQKPLLGHGYLSIWVTMSPDIIAFLQEKGITDPLTFNFHSTYLQIGVDLGLVGAGLMVCAFLGAILSGLHRFVLEPSVVSSFIFAFLLAQMSRTYTELVMGPFNSMTLVLFTCLAYAFVGPRTLEHVYSRQLQTQHRLKKA